MYKLYNVKAWGSLSAHCVLEELGVPYQNIWMTPEQVRAPEFREISPLGLIPALGLADGRAIFESAAILSFLTVAHAGKGMAPDPGTADHGVFLAWLHFIGANLYPAINLTYPGSGYAETPAQDAFIVAEAMKKCDRLFGMLETKLEDEGPWLMGETFSALDIYVFNLSLWAKPSEVALHAKFPHVAALAQALRMRPKLTAVLEAHGVRQLGGYGG